MAVFQTPPQLLRVLGANFGVVNLQIFHRAFGAQQLVKPVVGNGAARQQHIIRRRQQLRQPLAQRVAHLFGRQIIRPKAKLLQNLRRGPADNRKFGPAQSPPIHLRRLHSLKKGLNPIGRGENQPAVG